MDGDSNRQIDGEMDRKKTKTKEICHSLSNLIKKSSSAIHCYHSQSYCTIDKAQVVHIVTNKTQIYQTQDTLTPTTFTTMKVPFTITPSVLDQFILGIYFPPSAWPCLWRGVDL